MAEAPVTTKAPAVPSREEAGQKLPSGTPVPLGPTAATEPAAIDQMAKLNHQLQTTLINDNEVLTERYNDYNNALLEQQGTNAAKPGTEARGFQALENRDLTGNSGIALRGRESLAERFQNVKNTQALKFTQGLNTIARGAQNLRGNIELTATQAEENARRRRAAEIAKAPLQAAPLNPTYAAAAEQYPKATEVVNRTFPGGINEQRAWIKANSKYRAKGGPVEAGNAYIVGEQGPEIMVPRTGGKIIPNARGQAMRRAASRGRRH